MHNRIGTYLVQKSTPEHFKAYIPPKLPPYPPIDLARLYPRLEAANRALAELNVTLKYIPQATRFVDMYVCKEALLSSQIEGTQSSFSDLMLFEHQYQPAIALEDVEEASHYVQAIRYGIDRLDHDFPLSLRLLREIHGILLSGGRGSAMLPGEFRRSQNWIGGTRPGNALYVPPPVDCLHKCLKDFEWFLHDDSLPVLIKAGLAHVQFESIHPFLDGNGRLGRLLITQILCAHQMLDEPILYLSLYLKQHRGVYYQLLQEVRESGTWENWLEFFLEGVTAVAQQGMATTHKIHEIFAADRKKIQGLGRARFSCEKIFEFIQRLPHVTASSVAEELSLTPVTARSSLNHMVSLGILEEITGKKRDRVYVYRHYLDVLSEGAEPLSD